MKALVCDICGGKLIMGSGGIAVCESCGMEHSHDRMQEKIQEIKGVVRVDNSHMVANYLDIALRSYSSSNLEEAEAYCNKILEIDPKNYEALMLKGKTAGWQSTLYNIRFSEAITLFLSSIQNVEEELKDELIDDVKVEIEKLSLAIIKLQGDRFEKYPDEDETTGFMKCIIEIFKGLILFATSVGVDIIDKDLLMAPVALIINKSVTNAWKNKIVPDYKEDYDGHPGDYAFKTLIRKGDYCIQLLEQAIKLSNKDDHADILYYQNINVINEFIINSCSYEYRTVKIPGTFWTDYRPSYENRYCKNLTLTENAKAARRAKIAENNKEINRIKEELAAKEASEKAEKERIAFEKKQKRIDEYWKNHVQEKLNLEKEKDELSSQIDVLSENLDAKIEELMTQIETITGNDEISYIEEYLVKLKEDKSQLGMFKGKEKQALQNQIDSLLAEKSKIENRVDSEKNEINLKITQAKSEYNIKVAPLQRRLEAIVEELTKDR